MWCLEEDPTIHNCVPLGSYYPREVCFFAHKNAEQLYKKEDYKGAKKEQDCWLLTSLTVLN